jgi:hypothetical protein
MYVYICICELNRMFFFCRFENTVANVYMNINGYLIEPFVELNAFLTDKETLF